MRGGSKPKNRKATCHPDRRHQAKGLCKLCYQRVRNGSQSKRAKYHEGLVRVPVPGWGARP